MNSQSDAQQGDSRPPAHLALGLVLVWLLVQLGLLLIHAPAALDGGLTGPDSYMRMVRVGELLQGEGWYDSTIARSNAPYGETLHWSRPFDLLLILLALPAALFVGLSGGLTWAAVAVSPLLQLACAAALAWAVAPLLGRGLAALAALIFLLQPALLYAFLPGRPDHHGFLLLIFALSLGWTLRAAIDPGSRRAALAAGALGGLALWASLELAIALAVGTLALALSWIVEGGEQRRRQNLAYATGLAVVLAVALIVERPPAEVLRAVYDKVSIVHLSLALLMAGFWTIAALPNRRGLLDRPAPRLVAGLAGAAAALACLHLLFPRVLGGPMVDVHPEIRDIWLDRVTEMQPVFPDSARGLEQFLTSFGSGLLGLAFLAWILARDRDRVRRRAWAAIALAIAVTLPLGILHLRMAGFAALVLVIPLTELAGRLLHWSGGIASLLPRALLRGLVLAGTVAGGLAAAQAVVPSAERAAGEPETGARGAAVPAKGKVCALPALAAHLTATQGATDLALLALLDHGPELLYRTPYSVVATPYHRNGPGIIDAHAAMTAGDPEAARQILEARGIDLVLLCPQPVEEMFFAPRPGAAGQGQTLYTRLLTGRPPAWLRPVALPPELAARFKLFAVQPPDA
ncbi:MAG: hypothetical protein QNI93_08525 [Kiloniellales bacterium]|nr:hypothetical protein [Kiloniellales bacterium]